MKLTVNGVLISDWLGAEGKTLENKAELQKPMCRLQVYWIPLSQQNHSLSCIRS